MPILQIQQIEKDSPIFKNLQTKVEELQFHEVEIRMHNNSNHSKIYFESPISAQVSVFNHIMFFKTSQIIQTGQEIKQDHKVESILNNEITSLLSYTNCLGLFMRLNDEDNLSIMIQDQSSFPMQKIELKFHSTHIANYFISKLKEYCILARDINIDYDINQVLINEGSQAKIYKATMRETCITQFQLLLESPLNDSIANQNLNDKISSQFAIKQYQIESLNHKNQIYKEISFLNQFKGNESILPLLGTYEYNEKIYLIFNLMTDGDLCDLIEKYSQLEEEQIKHVILQLLFALDHSHRLNLIHRDIKPDNIMIKMENINFNEHSNQTKNIKVCLTDFGLACHKYDKVSVNQLCGSPGFMAPEVFKNEPFNTSADIFSLGCVFYNLLTKQFLFPGSTLQKLILSNKFAYPFDLVERTTFPINYSESCIDLLKKMLDKNSKIRFTAEKCLLHEWFEKDRKIIIHQIFKNQILSQQYPENQYDFNSRLRKESKSLLVVDRPIQSVDMESVEIPEENKKKPILVRHLSQKHQYLQNKQIFATQNRQLKQINNQSLKKKESISQNEDQQLDNFQLDKSESQLRFNYFQDQSEKRSSSVKIGSESPYLKFYLNNNSTLDNNFVENNSAQTPQKQSNIQLDSKTENNNSNNNTQNIFGQQEVVLNESGMIENNNNNSTFQFKNIKKIYQKSKFAKEQKISKVNIQKSGDSLFESENDEDQSNIISNLKFEDMKKQKTDQQILLSNQRNIRNKKATKDNDNEQVYSMENIQTEEVCEDLEEASINSPIFYLDQNCQDNLEQAFTFSNSLQNINNKAQFRRFE